MAALEPEVPSPVAVPGNVWGSELGKSWGPVFSLLLPSFSYLATGRFSDLLPCPPGPSVRLWLCR